MFSRRLKTRRDRKYKCILKTIDSAQPYTASSFNEVPDKETNILSGGYSQLAAFEAKPLEADGVHQRNAEPDDATAPLPTAPPTQTPATRRCHCILHTSPA